MAAQSVPLQGTQFYTRANYDLHRSIGFWSSLAMPAFAITGINLHIQTGGGLFTMMDDRSAAVYLPGHGASADGMLQSAREPLPEAGTMRISFWNDKRPVLVQMRFAEDHTPAGRSAVMLDPQTGAVLTVVGSRTAPLIYTALVEWNPRDSHGNDVRMALADPSQFLELWALPACRECSIEGGVKPGRVELADEL